MRGERRHDFSNSQGVINDEGDLGNTMIIGA